MLTKKYIKYKKKYLELKNKQLKRKKMIGGNLSEINSLDPSVKTIILMAELHTHKSNRLEYNNIITKQKEIINLVVSKFESNKTYFYSEGPSEARHIIFGTDVYSSSVIVQYATTIIPIKLSSITALQRETSDSNKEYCDDILSIFDENPVIDCIIVGIGLLHIPELKKFISEKRPEINIIIINTLSFEQLTPLIQKIRNMYPKVIDLIQIEIPYELPKETFDVEVLYNVTGDKIYKCPICNKISGTYAPKHPKDTSLFPHSYDCINIYKIPKEI